MTPWLSSDLWSAKTKGTKQSGCFLSQEIDSRKLMYEADTGVVLPAGRGMPGQQAGKGWFMLKTVYPLCMQPVVVV